MLGGIEDTKVTLPAICECEEYGGCQGCKLSIEEPCECRQYCIDNIDLYKTIVDGGKFCYITVSPKPDKMKSYADHLSDWLDHFHDTKDCVSHFILTVEFTSKGQIHFHGVFRLKDKIKWIKNHIQYWFHHANILPLYGKQPSLGIHYLFKRSTESAQILGAHTAVFNSFKFMKSPLFHRKFLRQSWPLRNPFDMGAEDEQD